MAVWERERVLALAPDAASTSAAQQLLRTGRWSATGSTGRSVWGRCQGSGRTPYQTVVDLVGPAYACSCPSRKFPCKHALALLLLWSAGQVAVVDTEADFAADWLRSRDARAVTSAAPRAAAVVDPEAAARRSAARLDKVSRGLEDLELWLQDQVRNGLAGIERAGYAHFDRVAARMVDAQAPGVASMLRSVPAELAGDGWPERVLERLGALHLLVRAHQRLAELPAELAANVRSRVGYPVARADVLSSPALADDWVALGAVDTVDYQLESRRVWLRGLRTGRWGVWLSFAAAGMSLDSSVLPGQLLTTDLHFYPGSSYRVLLGERGVTEDDPRDDRAAGLSAAGPSVPVEEAALAERLPTEDLTQVRRRLATLLAADPWATRMPALMHVSPVPPTQGGRGWQLRDEAGDCVDVLGLTGEPWPVLARSGGQPVTVFGEWSEGGFRPLSLLPDRHGNPISTVLAAP